MHSPVGGHLARFNLEAPIACSDILIVSGLNHNENAAVAVVPMKLLVTDQVVVVGSGEVPLYRVVRLDPRRIVLVRIDHAKLEFVTGAEPELHHVRPPVRVETSPFQRVGAVLRHGKFRVAIVTTLVAGRLHNDSPAAAAPIGKTIERSFQVRGPVMRACVLAQADVHCYGQREAIRLCSDVAQGVDVADGIADASAIARVGYKLGNHDDNGRLRRNAAGELANCSAGRDARNMSAVPLHELAMTAEHRVVARSVPSRAFGS